MDAVLDKSDTATAFLSSIADEAMKLTVLDLYILLPNNCPTILTLFTVDVSGRLTLH